MYYILYIIYYMLYVICYMLYIIYYILCINSLYIFFKFPIRKYLLISCKSFIIGCFDLGESNVVNFIDICINKHHLVD